MAFVADELIGGKTAAGAVDPASTAPASAQGDIVVTDVHKAFGVTRALDGCSFSSRRGEIHAIVGGNGCGKSTLAKVMSGVLSIDAGHVSVLGHAPATPREARLAGIATVFQEVLVADACTVLDNLFVGADGLWSRKLSFREKYETAERLMKDLTGLEIDPDALVDGLPLSVKQWITIGRALLRDPEVLILDESSAALDFDSTEMLFNKMRELRDRGTAVVIVTHRIAELIRISDRATVMRDGRDVGVLGVGEVTEQNLLALMTGETASREEPQSRTVSLARGDTVMRTRGVRLWPEGDKVSFDLHRGEIVGVAGLDGQGQNEFVRVLAGVDEPLEGETLIKNSVTGDFEQLRGLEDADRCGVAYVSGDRKREGIFPNLSIFENMLIPLFPKTVQTRIGNVIDWSSLGESFNTWTTRLSVKFGVQSDKITSLSGGNQQKILIGRAMALRPNIMVLNDPARGIDVEAKRELYDHLRAFAARGHSVVFMSSELEEFIGLVQRVVVFRHGSICDAFVGDDIDPVRLLEAMFGQTSGSGVGLAASVQAQERQVAGTPVLEPIRKPGSPPKPRDIKIIDYGRPERTRDRTDNGIKIMSFD